MTRSSASYHPSRSYDLFREVDHPPEDLPIRASDLLPIYALRGKNFYLYGEMDRFNPNIGMLGQIAVGPTATEWRVLAGCLQLGEILSDGCFWRADGKRFRLVEIKQK